MRQGGMVQSMCVQIGETSNWHLLKILDEPRVGVLVCVDHGGKKPCHLQDLGRDRGAGPSSVDGGVGSCASVVDGTS